MRTIRFALPVAFIILTAFSYPAKPIKLEYTFKVGDQYEMSQVSTQNIKQDIPGMGEVKIEVAVEGSMLFKIAEVTATGAKMETSYTNLKMVTKNPFAGNVTLDSKGPDDQPQNKVVKAILGKPFFVYMTRQGVIEKVENAENLYSGLGSIGLDSAMVLQMKASLQQSLGEPSIKASLEMALANYPTEKVAEGATWKNSTATAMSFPMVIENTWTFTKLEGPLALLDCEGTVRTTDKEKVTSLPNGIKTKSDLNGRQMIKAKVDAKSGWPTELKTLSEIKGNMMLLAGGMIPEDMNVPMEIVSENTFTIVKK